MANIYDYEIGTTFGGLANLEGLTVPVPAPRSTYQEYSRLVKLADGTSLRQGYPVATWTWGVLTRQQRDQLKYFCSAHSTAIYIRTKTNETASSVEEYKKFLCVMLWPEAEEKDAARRRDFVLTFTHMVVVTS